MTRRLQAVDERQRFFAGGGEEPDVVSGQRHRADPDGLAPACFSFSVFSSTVVMAVVTSSDIVSRLPRSALVDPNPRLDKGAGTAKVITAVRGCCTPASVVRGASRPAGLPAARP